MTQRLTAAALLVCVCASAAQGAKFTLEKDTEGVSVNCDGQLFTRYIIKSGTKPILWPIVGPTGKEMTRGYPMRTARGSEASDHVHQRSLWFDHGNVNGISFWDESEGHGNIEHIEYLTLTDGDQALIRTRNAWRAPDGKVVCEDVRSMIFGTAMRCGGSTSVSRSRRFRNRLCLGTPKRAASVCAWHPRSPWMRKRAARLSIVTVLPMHRRGENGRHGSTIPGPSTAKWWGSRFSTILGACDIRRTGMCELTVCLPPTRLAYVTS